MTKVIFFVNLLVLFLSCKDNSVRLEKVPANRSSDVGMPTEISKVKINNRTGFNTNYEKIILGSDTLHRFALEIDSLHPFVIDAKRYDFPEKNNFGFYELEVYSSKRKIFKVSIIYTVYHGVIIIRDGERFKNDNLESLVKSIMASM